MNTISAHSLTNPFGETSECARFVIDDTTDAFVLSSVATVGEQHTFSFWLRSEAAGNVSVADTNFVSSGAWQKHKVTFVAANANLLLTFGAVGTYYLYHAQLELGNMATDWSPAPEDMATGDDLSSNVEALGKTIIEQAAKIKTENDKLLLSALEKYVVSDGEDYSALKEAISDLQLSSSGLLASITQAQKDIHAVDDDLQAKFNEISLIFSITIDGVTIGRTESPYKLFLDDNEFSMQINGNRVLWFEITENEKSANIPELNVTEKFTIFGLVGIKDQNGNINWVPSGGV